MKLTPEILRHLIIEKKKKTAEEIQKELELQEKMLRKTEDKLDQQEETPVTVKEEKKEKKISLDDLDVRLDEILKMMSYKKNNMTLNKSFNHWKCDARP